MTELDKYDAKISESKWQKHWESVGIYHFADDLPKEQTFTIDTPPPTVSGVLHMGHIFSYTQADFIARYQRMSGKDVFYPMGFDDNGLPTERLVEKVKKIQAHRYIAEHGRDAFVTLCREVVIEAEEEFRRLFKSTALSVDWRQEYQTISDDVRALSQASFLDLIEKSEAYRDFRPTYWDWKDGTAIANAEIEEKELEGIQCTIPFGVMDADEWDVLKDAIEGRPTFESLEKVHVMTTRPELLGACVALMLNPEDEAAYKGKVAVSPLFNVVVPICTSEKVDKEKGTGFVMCCSWGDDTDKEWIAEHGLAWRPLIDMDGKIKLAGVGQQEQEIADEKTTSIIFLAGKDGEGSNFSQIWHLNCFDVVKALSFYRQLEGKKLIRDIKNENSAKGKALKLLDEAGLLLESPHPNPLPEGEGVQKPSPSGRGLGEGSRGKNKVLHKAQTVKCAERSGVAMEIIPTYQWFIRLMDKKVELKAKGDACNWHPEFMKLRLHQWIDGLKEDWCISRQRYFGVPFPVWISKREGEEGTLIYADANTLPIDPLTDLPTGYAREEVEGYPDVMDTWATSSISPQINAGGLLQKPSPPGRGLGEGSSENTDAEIALTPGTREKGTAVPFSRAPSLSQGEREKGQNPKLFPASLRPQAHEIIRTWAFYTIAIAHLHTDSIPWENLMISGWCLASDKTKMSKSKGNVVTPVDLIEEKGADAVRYWASTSKLGSDTAFSEDVLKIGKKLVGKIFNASKFVSPHIAKVSDAPATAADAIAQGLITETLDKAILSRLHGAVSKASAAFEVFEYADARVAIEDFFWNDYCDNYLELVKGRAYGANNPVALHSPKGDAGSAGSLSEDTARDPAQSAFAMLRRDSQDSSHLTLHYITDAILRLFAPIVPHVTEEVFTTLYPQTYSKQGSIHARGSWPKVESYVRDEKSEAAFVMCLELLEAVRKAKSEASVSIKYPVELFEMAAADGQTLDEGALESIKSDLCAAGNIAELKICDALKDATPTESGDIYIKVTLAEQAEERAS